MAVSHRVGIEMTTDYVNKALMHRGTESVAVVTDQFRGVLGALYLRLKFGDGSIETATLSQIEDRFEWLDGLHGTVRPPVVVLQDNVVPFVPRRARVIPITTGPGSAA